MLHEAIADYGVRAVTGRDTLAAHEIIRMRYARALKSIYQSRAASQNWAEWAKDNPESAKVLNEAERIYNE